MASKKRSGKMARVGGQDYTGMDEAKVLKARTDRIKSLFSKLNGAISSPKQDEKERAGMRAQAPATGSTAARLNAVPPMPTTLPHADFMREAEAYADSVLGPERKPAGPEVPPGFYDKTMSAIRSDPALAASIGVTGLQAAPSVIPALASAAPSVGGAIGSAAPMIGSAASLAAQSAAPAYLGYRIGSAMDRATAEEVGGRRGYLDTLADLYRMYTQPRASLSEDIPAPQLPSFEGYTK